MPKPATKFLVPLNAVNSNWVRIGLDLAYPGIALNRMPRSLKILLESVARCAPEVALNLKLQDGMPISGVEVPFYPNRVLMHDTTCLPALADIAAMRDAVKERGGDPRRINPEIPVHLVIDHSIAADHHGHLDAPERNLELDFHRNSERYRFVKWAEQSLENFRVVPPGTGIIHQVNLEYLAEIASIDRRVTPRTLVHADTLIGTDSHTPMVNALGVLAWGVGGVEAEGAMTGEPVAVALPKVTGVKLKGRLRPGITATDLVLNLTALLRSRGVIGQFVEFYGPGVHTLSPSDRAVVSNMAPEYGPTCSFFPIDEQTLGYLRLTGRSKDQIALVEAYAKAQGLWLSASDQDPACDTELVVDLGAIGTTVAGPRHPHDRKALAAVAADFVSQLPQLAVGASSTSRTFRPQGADYDLVDGAVALAAITSCTNTSNPALLIAAGLLARKARRLGLKPWPWVKTTLSPGSAAVSAYLTESGLQDDLNALGFHVVGMGCMTCIGNSGKLAAPVIEAVEGNKVAVVGVLSGNRNFDGRVNPHLAGAYLASPALVVAYSIAGRITLNLESEALGTGPNGKPVYLSDIMPTDGEVADVVQGFLVPRHFKDGYLSVWKGPKQWQALKAPAGDCFQWDPKSDYIRRPPYFDGIDLAAPVDLTIRNAKVALMLGDNVTTDHISPAGPIPLKSLAGQLLASHGLPVADFNQYSTRRSNHEIMMRGAFSNPRLRNELMTEEVFRFGGITWNADRTKALTFYESALSHGIANQPLVVVAGKNYGAGSSRDIAAKVTALLGVKVVIAETYERIHRSNLIALGVVPLTFENSAKRSDTGWNGTESLEFQGLDRLQVGNNLIRILATGNDGAAKEMTVNCRIDSNQELDYLQRGGILRCVVQRALAPSRKAA
jgi:aconitate hydratase